MHGGFLCAGVGPALLLEPAEVDKTSSDAPWSASMVEGDVVDFGARVEGGEKFRAFCVGPGLSRIARQGIFPPLPRRGAF